MFWLFNRNKFSFRGDQNKVSIFWEQRRNFKGEIGDRVVFFDFGNTSHLFTGLFTIIDIDKKNIGNNTEQNYSIRLVLQQDRDFREEKEIEDYIFSFPRIRYFGRWLSRHFRARYYRISEVEFTAIVDDKIFFSRTVLGTSLNSLHIEHRKAFIQLLIERFPNILQNRYHHSDVLELFEEYFQFAIETPAKQLVDAFENMRSFVDNGILNRIAFSDPFDDKKQNTDNISVQVRVINENLERREFAILSGDNFSANEYMFDRIFRDKPLPIDINE